MASYTYKTLSEFNLANDISKIAVPSGYTKLNYIRSSGSQYIDTGIVPTANTRIYMVAEPSNGFGSGWQWFFGATTSTYNGIALYAQNGKAYSNYNNDISIGGLFSLNTRVVIDRNKNELYIDGNLIRTDNVLSVTLTNKIFLLCRGQNDTPQGYISAKLYLEQIYENDIFLQKLIPCEDGNGNIGMYDVISDTFFANQGTNPFISGGTAPTFQDGDEIYISSLLTYYHYQSGELVFWYQKTIPSIYYVNIVNEENLIGSDPLIMYLNVCEVTMEEDKKANSLFMGCE